MAVATQEVFYHTDALVETWDVGTPTPALTLVKQAGSGRYGVTLTNTAGITTKRTHQVGPYDFSAPTFPGVGNDADEVVATIGAHATGVAVDGTWEFEDVADATVTTAQGTPVFSDGSGGLTTATGGDRVGVVNYPASYTKVEGVLPVKIGA